MRNTLVIKQGDKYGRLSVVKELEPIVQPSGAKKRIVICKCECGNTKTFRLSDLRSNKTKSCGCFQKQIVTKHNDAGKDKQHYYLHQTYQLVLYIRQVQDQVQYYPSLINVIRVIINIICKNH